MHGTLTPELALRLQELRSGCDLYFDSGDAIKTGNVGIPLKPEAVWPMLDVLRCDAGVLGNRETHLWQGPFEAKLAGATHPILCANFKRKDGTTPLKVSLNLERAGLRIGVVGVMVPMVTARMKTQAASVYLWDPPIPVALQLASELRPQVDVLFALTHIGHRQDRELAETGAFDAIFGGHSHTVLKQPELMGKCWIAQGGSHNRFAGVYEWDGALSGGLVSLKPG